MTTVPSLAHTSTRVARICPTCALSFTTQTWHVARGRGVYCSPHCSNMGRRNTEETFWERVNKDGPVPSHQPHLGACWLWTDRCSPRGYGEFVVAGRTMRAHRYSYERAYGAIPPHLIVCHHCDVPGCVRPSHLFLGTHADNAADRSRKGRTAQGDRNGLRLHPECAARGEKHHLAKLSAQNVRDIRASYAAGGMSQKRLARQYGVSKHTVYTIVHGETWRHVPD